MEFNRKTEFIAIRKEMNETYAKLSALQGVLFISKEAQENLKTTLSNYRAACAGIELLVRNLENGVE